jgi:purine catabolism regulator
VATVTDLLGELPGQLTVLNPARDDVEVRWVATSELADPTPFLEGGELLLTTGIETAAWTAADWTAYVDRLSAAGTAALGLGTGLTHRRVPRALVAACRRRDLALVEVPRDTTFVTVSRAAVRLTGSRQEAELRKALETQRDLTSAAVRHDPRREVVRTLSRALDADVVLATTDGRELAASKHRHLIDLHDVSASVARIRKHGVRGAASTASTDGALVVMPVGLRQTPLQYLVVASTTAPNQAQRNALTTAVALLAFVSDQERRALKSRRLLAVRVFELLMHGEASVAGIVAEAAEFEKLPARIRLVRASGPPGLQEEALAHLDTPGLLAASFVDELWVITAAGAALDVAGQVARSGLRVGVGLASRLTSFDRAERTAAQALSQASPAVPVVVWDDVMREGVTALMDPDSAEAFADSFLAGLTNEDLDTLEAFLRHNGARAGVAEELGIHRNTVRQRVDRIERVLRRSLEDPSTRASGWLALQWKARLQP